MKYYNREYGFKGRPPYFKDFFEVSDSGPRVNIANFPWDSIVGYGLHYSEKAGVALIGKRGTVWGAKIVCLQRGKWVEHQYVTTLKDEYFTIGSDNKFAYFTVGEIAASIVAYKKSALVMSLSAIKNTKVRVVFYPIVPEDGQLSVQNNIVNGVASARAVIKGKIIAKDYDVEFRDRYEVVLDDKKAKKEYFFAKSYNRTTIASNNKKEVVFEFELTSSEPHAVVYLEVSEKDSFDNVPTLNELNDGISREEIVFSAENVNGTGTLGGSIGKIVSNCCANRIYDPYIMESIFVEKRGIANFYYNFDPTEMAQGAVIASLLGQNKSAFAQIEAACADKIMGALVSWIVYMRTRDKEVILKTLPTILANFPANGELALADPLTKREVAYKQEGSPLKEVKAEQLFSLDYSCYKLIALEVAYKMAQAVGDMALVKTFKAFHSELKGNINDKLYNDKLGMYMDRYVSGEFVPFYGATNFLPLTAGVIDDIQRLEHTVQNLKDPNKFFGEYMVSTIAKNNVYYGKKPSSFSLELSEPYRGYRGEISPFVNYLIYLGLLRYGICDLRAELASSSCRLWEREFEAHKAVPATFLPTTKGAKQVQNALSGNLMGLLGIEELVGVEYFREDLRPALHFGSLNKGGSGVANYRFWGYSFTVNASEKATTLQVDGKEVIRGEGGKFTIRNLAVNPSGIEFYVLAAEDIEFDIKLPIFPGVGEERNYHFNIEKGKTMIVIDAHKVRPIRNKISN